jgi:hypothetical protein
MMFQRLQLLKRLLGLFLSRHQGLALLERVQASNLSEADRNRVSYIMRTLLRLPDAPGDEPAAPATPAPSAPASRRQERPTS